MIFYAVKKQNAPPPRLSRRPNRKALINFCRKNKFKQPLRSCLKTEYMITTMWKSG
jgi:hypothetical protein